MPEELSLPLLILTAYIWIIILGGLAALIFDFRNDAKGDRMTLPGWNLSWREFGFGAGVFFFTMVSVAPILAYYALEVFDISSDDTSFSALLSGVIFHGLSLVLIFGVIRRPNFALKIKLSPVSLRGGEIGTFIGLFFLAGTLLALSFGKIWEVTLTFLESHGLAPKVEPQDLVAIFSEGGFGAVSIGLIFLAVIVAPITEEFIFRAGIYRFMKGRFSARLALVTSSVLFALMHFNIMSFLPLLLLGMLLCRSYERSGNILVPIGFHALFNANNIFLLLFQAELEPMMDDMATGVILIISGVFN